MAFPSSVPLYLDPPSWHHHHNQQPHNINQQAGITPQGGNQNPLQLPPGPTPTTTKSPQQAPTVSVQLPHHVGVGGSGSIRPNSMVDQARQARLPQPEAGLNCPRCESTNTKFCYFNNYSLTQPRHFCKTCRRYWTKGGALRNVPVGGGCRKNKKSRSKSKSKSKQPAEERSSCSTPSAAFPEMFVNHHLMGHESSTHLLPYNIASLQNLGQQHYGNVDNVGLNIFGSAAVEAGMGGGKVGVNFEVCGDGGMSAGEWRLGGQMEQFPLMGGVGLEQPPLYPFHQSGDERNGVIGGRDLLGSKIHDDEVEMEVEGSSAVKMEGQTRQGLHVRSQTLDISDNGNHGLYYDNSDNKYYLTDLTAAGGFGICSTSAGSSALFFS